MTQLSVLFVCTANICRSPMAMGLLRSKIDSESSVWRIESAGVHAVEGMTASEFTQVVLEKRGIQIRYHLSQKVTRELLESFNLILVMETNHKDAIHAAYPDIRDRVFLMSEMVGGTYDIVDPIGRSLHDYEQTAHEMEKILDNGFSKIAGLASSKK